MADYFNTRKFTLVPAALNSAEEQAHILRNQFGLGNEEIIRSAALPKYNVLLVYSANYTDENSVGNIASEASFPVIYKYIQRLEQIPDNNKAVLEYNPDKKTACIVIGEGENLIMANSYHAADFNSAVYFLLETLHQRQMNPAQTVAEVYGEISDSELNRITTFLKGVHAGE